MSEKNNGLPGKFSERPGQINRLVKLEPIKRDQAKADKASASYERDPNAKPSSADGLEVG